MLGHIVTGDGSLTTQQRVSGSLLNDILPTNNTPWPLARERTVPTERPPLVDEI
jgi:hypothetical protein